MIDKPKRYAEWLKFVFNHPHDREWYFSLHKPTYFKAPHQELVRLITATCIYCGTDLRSYSNAEVKDGIAYIFNNSCSDVIFAIMDEQVAIQQRLEAIHAIKLLYKDCFEVRCTATLISGVGKGANPLNEICFMLWDVMPFTNWNKSAHKTALYDAAVDVLEYALTLSNPACKESALHGLGHMLIYHSIKIGPVFERFLAQLKPGDKQLFLYAQAAARGAIL